MTLELRQTVGQVGLWRTDGSSTLPGQPRVQLQSVGLQDYLRDTYRATELDNITPYLWLVSTDTVNLTPLICIGVHAS
jgi:hypothetical protein